MPSRHPVICGIGLSDYPVAPHLNSVQHHAGAARRHMHEFGTSSEQLAEIAVGAREFARLNPEAVEIGMPVIVYAGIYDGTHAMVFWEPA